MLVSHKLPSKPYISDDNIVLEENIHTSGHLAHNPVPHEVQGFYASSNACANQIDTQDEIGTLQSSNSSEDELALYLDQIEKDSLFKVAAVLKESEFEITQKVYLPCEGNELKGPFIRKYLDRDVGLGKVYKDLFHAEQAGFSFTHLPKVYSCYELKNQLAVVMEYVQGETLQELLDRCNPSVNLAMEIFPNLCDAVSELHEKFHPSIIHRDLKPSNIILSFNRLVLIDFGIAREYREGLDADTIRFGTREYAPPEQFGYGQTDVRSDVYALGMLLYYCLTKQTADLKVRRARFVDEKIPEVFRVIIDRACSFDPADRFACVADFKKAFLQACGLWESPMLCTLNSYPTAVSTQTQYLGNKNKVRYEAISQLRKPAKQVAAFFDRIPIGIGIAWNIALFLLWGLVLAAAFSLLIDPVDSTARSFPLWYCIVGYGMYVPLVWTSLTYAFFDKRLLFRKFPKICRFTFSMRFLLFVIGFPFLMTLIMGLATLFLGP